MTILQGYLYSDVAQAGTVTIAYPSGFSPDSLDKAGAKACLLSVNSSMPDGSYSLAWGGSSVVVTNLSGTWKGGVSVFISVPDVVNGQGEIVRATTDLTGGSTLSGPTSTLKLPPGETDLSGGVAGSGGPEKTGCCAMKMANTYLEGAATYKTIQVSIASNIKFYAIRLAVANYSTAAASSLTNVKVASSPVLADGGSTLTWSQVTWNGGSQSVTIPIATGSGVDILPGIVFSDICYVTAVPRTDIPTDPYLFYIRAYDNALRYGSLLVPKQGTDADAWLLANGYTFLYGGSVTDQVTSTTTNLGQAAAFPQCPISAVEFYGPGDFFSLHAFGDSLLAGYSGNANSHTSGWCNRVSYKMRLKQKVGGIANWGIGGSHQNVYIQRMKDVCTQYKPSAVYFSPFSPNSGSSQGALDSQMGATLEAIQWLRQRDIWPIISTAMPQTTVLDQPTKDRLDAFNVGIKALSTSATVWDFASVIDPTGSGVIKAEYAYLTGPHFNYVGDAALAAYVAAQLGVS